MRRGQLVQAVKMEVCLEDQKESQYGWNHGREQQERGREDSLGNFLEL